MKKSIWSHQQATRYLHLKKNVHQNFKTYKILTTTSSKRKKKWNPDTTTLHFDHECISKNTYIHECISVAAKNYLQNSWQFYLYFQLLLLLLLVTVFRESIFWRKIFLKVSLVFIENQFEMLKEKAILQITHYCFWIQLL